jgi:1-acyl-sn-glycerol-3-phosphate acyltransferase
VFVANRTGHLDALVLAAALPCSFLLADGSDIPFMTRRAAVLLKDLAVEPVPDEAHPPGGTLRDRVRQALAAGHSVLVLPDSAPGSPAHLSRFRLDAFHAAQLTSRPLVPLGVRGTSRLLDQASPGVHHPARITVGTAIDAPCSGRRELVALRERVRTAIAELCR